MLFSGTYFALFMRRVFTSCCASLMLLRVLLSCAWLYDSFSFFAATNEVFRVFYPEEEAKKTEEEQAEDDNVSAFFFVSRSLSFFFVFSYFSSICEQEENERLHAVLLFNLF